MPHVLFLLILDKNQYFYYSIQSHLLLVLITSAFCLCVFYFIQVILLSLPFSISLVWFYLHPNWPFHPYIDIYILQIPQIQHLQMEFQLLTKHALLPPRFLSLVLHHHFTKQSAEECVHLLFSSHFSHPFVYHFRLFCLWNISQVWTYCYCADSGYHHCFLGEWQLSLLISSPDVSIASLICLPEWQKVRILKLWWSFLNTSIWFIFCNFKGKNESQ